MKLYVAEVFVIHRCHSFLSVRIESQLLNYFLIFNRDTKIAQLLRDSLGNITCRTCMIAHVSSAIPHYNETLQVIQLAARIHRMRRRKTKVTVFFILVSFTDTSYIILFEAHEEKKFPVEK